ncbi:YkvA family protein [Pseudomonas sp. NY15437]|uniref:YkvA family protein n=1 Tax=Pseudomonas sp. NY15437 TaxID=3400360 RepID=UPI003A89B7A9
MTTFESNADDFSEGNFWAKVATYAKKAGSKVILKALEVYYISSDEKTPTPVRALGFGALTYFVCPIDLIPDLGPLGYVDDMAMLMSAATALAPYFTDEIRQKARQTFAAIFD